jgi:26S proteasome regulatory subunit N2
MSQSGGLLVGLASGTLQSSVKPLSSGASALLALLEEKEDALKVFALEKMNANVDEYWFQLSGSVAHVEALFEDEEFSHRELAALVASKVSYAKLIIDL